MRSKRFVSPAFPRVLGAESLGVTKKVTAEIVKDVRKKLNQSGRTVTVKAMRFIPSSRTITANGSFQVVANTVIEEKPSRSSMPRSETLDSVVTVGRKGRVQKLEDLTIPELQRAAS
jgi:hypothetical protein